MPDTTPPAATYTLDQVLAALNSAADDIIDAAGPAVDDTVNLTVNAAVSYLDGTAASLGEAIEAGYDEDAATVIGWVTG